MCHVQRVSNSCGHRNDHVTLTCHYAKAGYNLAFPIEDTNTNLSHITTYIPTFVRTPDGDFKVTHVQRVHDNRYTFQQARALAVEREQKKQVQATTATTATAANESNAITTNTTPAGTSNANDAADTATIIQSVLQHRGFHASSSPYCKDAHVRYLDSAVGFACMVEGCGRAD